MSSEKNPNYKSAKKLDKGLEAPVTVASGIAGWGEFITNGKDLVKRIYDFFEPSKDSDLFNKKMPPVLNLAFGVLGLVVAVVAFPLSIYDSAKKFLKIVDTDNKLTEKGVSKIHDLDGDTSLGFKIIQFILSVFRTGAAGVLAFAAVIGFLTGKITLSTLLTSTTAKMAAIFGFFALGVTAVIAGVNLVKSFIKWRNVSNLEKTFKENFDEKHLDKNVDFENLVDFLRNEDVKSIHWETFSRRFSNQFIQDVENPDPRALQLKALFEKHLPRNKVLGMDRGFQRIDLEALENALKGNLELKNSPDLNTMLQFVRETRLEIEKNVRHTFVDKNRTVTAKELKEYLDLRDDYWKLKKDLTEMGINPKKDPELARHNIYLKEKRKEAYEEVEKRIAQLLDQPDFKEKLETEPGYGQALNSLEKIYKNQVNLERFAALACKHDSYFKTLFENYKKVAAEQAIIDKKLTKRLKGKDSVDENSLNDFLEFSQKYGCEKERMIGRMGRDPEQLKDLINIVEARKGKLEGKLVGKGISLGLAIIGLVIGAFTGFPLLLLIGISAVTLIWTLVDKFAPLPWKKWGTDEKRQEPCVLSGSKLTQYLKSQDHKNIVQDHPEHSVENVEQQSEFGQKVESMKYQALMRKEMELILQSARENKIEALDEEPHENKVEDLNIQLQEVQEDEFSEDNNQETDLISRKEVKLIQEDMLTDIESLVENAKKIQQNQPPVDENKVVTKTVFC